MTQAIALAHQQIALACLFPHVTPGGLYFIEDLNWQPEELERADVPENANSLASEMLQISRDHKRGSAVLAAIVESIRLSDTRDIYNLDKRDALGLLTRRS